MSNEKKQLDKDLEALLDEAAKEVVSPSDALLDRVMAAAEQEVELREAAQVASPSRGKVAIVLAALGGWPAVAGLATATVAGIWLGYAAPVSLDGTISAGQASEFGYDLGDMMPDYDNVLGEG